MATCQEAADVNGDGITDFVGDTIFYAKASLPAVTHPEGGRDGDFDIDGNSLMADYVGDVIWAAKLGLIKAASASRTFSGQDCTKGRSVKAAPRSVGWRHAEADRPHTMSR